MNEDGEWTGLVGELVKGNADIITSHTDIIPQRAEVIDYLETLHFTR